MNGMEVCKSIFYFPTLFNSGGFTSFINLMRKESVKLVSRQIVYEATDFWHKQINLTTPWSFTSLE
jgi:hypothetical protein